VEARKALKRSNSLEMIIIKSEKKDLLDDEFESGEDEDKVSMLLNSKARKKSKYMTTESALSILGLTTIREVIQLQH